jgi:hypothetical protein
MSDGPMMRDLRRNDSELYCHTCRPEAGRKAIQKFVDDDLLPGIPSI